MVKEITIDHVGRLVIPKPFRERFGLGPGSRLTIAEEDGRLTLTPGRSEPRLEERDGFLVVDIAGDNEMDIEAGASRDERLRQLVEYALRR